MKTSRGFTLIELLLVIALIGMLSVLGTASYVNSQRQARNSRKVQDLKAVQTAFETYYTVNGRYPANCNQAIDTLPQGMPINPSTNAQYTGTCKTTDYCLCAQLESSNGNSTNANCTFSGSPRTYTCVNNLQ